jgi:LCP family protein required for cell wall assembly
VSYEPPLPPHLDPRGRHRGGRHWKTGTLRIVMSVLAVVSVGLLVLAGYTYYTFRGIDQGVTRLNVAVGGKATNSPAKTYNGKDQNILLVGNDDRTNLTQTESRKLHAGQDGGSQNTDTMMIVHVPADGSRATLISLPRDSYVHIKGHGMDRLNSAYVFGYNENSNATQDERRSTGANLLISTITDLTGLTIDHYIQVSLLGFYEISNAIGGVPVTLCHAVDDSHAANQAAGLSGGSGFKASKGRHIIKGVTALEFVRQRHFLPRGDLDRVRRQQYFLTSAFRQVASAGILFKLNALGDAIKRNIVFDPGLHLIDLAHQMENLSANNIIGRTIPTTAAMINGADVLSVSPAKVRLFVDHILNPVAASPSTSAGRPSTTTTAPKSGTSTTPSASATKAIDAKCIN